MAATIKLLIFGGAKSLVGSSEVEFPLPAPCTAAELLEKLIGQYPGLGGHRRSLRLAVNGTYADAGDRISPGDEVALIPPVAGG